MATRPPSSRLLAVLLAVAAVVAVVGGASSGGAQVSPPDSSTKVWASSCVSPAAAGLVVYGRGWAPGPVEVTLADAAGVLEQVTVDASPRSGRGAVFQARVVLPAPLAARPLRLEATQGDLRAEHRVSVLDGCGGVAPAVEATVDGNQCAPPGRAVEVALTVREAPISRYVVLLHHADLYGPAEVVDDTSPPASARPGGSYTLTLKVSSVPDRRVPVTVEAQRVDGSSVYATTDVTLPPACPATTTTTTRPPNPGSSTSSTTPPTMAPPATPATPAPQAPPAGAVPLSPFPGPQGPVGRAQVSLALSPAVGRAGEATTVAGTGFAPSVAVTLRWRPGVGEWTVAAGGDGSFRTQVLVLPNDVEGPRQLEVVEGGAAPASYLVVPGSGQPAFGGVFLRG